MKHTPIKPMSHRERTVAQRNHIFLLRNIDKVRQIRQKARVQHTSHIAALIREPSFTSTDVFITQFTALKTARSVKTR